MHVMFALPLHGKGKTGITRLDLLSSNRIVEIAEREILRRLIDVESDFLDKQVLRPGAGDGGAKHFPVGLV